MLKYILDKESIEKIHADEWVHTVFCVVCQSPAFLAQVDDFGGRPVGPLDLNEGFE